MDLNLICKFYDEEKCLKKFILLEKKFVYLENQIWIEIEMFTQISDKSNLLSWKTTKQSIE